MHIDPLSDGHIHTAYCHHAVGEMEEYVVAAIEKGLKEIFFLEHMEEGIKTQRVTWLSEHDFDSYFEEGQQLKESYSADITIGLGVEVGFNPSQVESLLIRIQQRPWDRIGISLHFFQDDTSKPHLNLVSKRDPRLVQLTISEAEAIEREYYHNLTQAVELIPGTILCHIDGVLRYYPQRQKIEPPWDLIDMLLNKVVTKGIALEVNTSGLAIRNEVFPGKVILQKALAKKIPLVAGSDAHKPEDVGYGFDGLNAYLEGLLTT